MEDRTSKHYPGYGLTALGAQQNFQVGQDYRNTYLLSNSSKQILGISEERYVSSQIYASAPDQKILLNAATAFLQGLYPPLEEVSTETLTNGTTYSNPLDGYQYVVLHSEDSSSPDSIWLKGDDSCPAYTTASSAFKASSEFRQRTEATASFYERFWPLLQNVHDYTPEDMTYANAYDIYDLINVATVHNASFAAAGNRAVSQSISESDLHQLRTLADSAEFAANYNASEAMRSIGGQTLAGAVLARLSETVATHGKSKFSLLAGSYDTFLSFFGITNLTAASGEFFGLPNYAASMAFEVFTTENNVRQFPGEEDISVRFLFKNGSDVEARAFPLFGRSEVLPWSEFKREIEKRAVTSVEQWCTSCGSTVNFCLPYIGSAAAGSAGNAGSSASPGGLSNVAAGLIGMAVTLGVVVLCGIAFWLSRRRAAAGGAGASGSGLAETGMANKAGVSVIERKGSASSGSSL